MRTLKPVLLSALMAITLLGAPTTAHAQSYNGGVEIGGGGGNQSDGSLVPGAGSPVCDQSTKGGIYLGVRNYLPWSWLCRVPGAPTVAYTPGLKQCLTGYDVYRFYGTRSNPVISSTVSRVELPAWCPENATQARAFFPNPMDAGVQAGAPELAGSGIASSTRNIAITDLARPAEPRTITYSDPFTPTTGNVLAANGQSCSALQVSGSQSLATAFADPKIRPALQAALFRQYQVTYNRYQFLGPGFAVKTARLLANLPPGPMLTSAQAITAVGSGVPCSSLFQFTPANTTPSDPVTVGICIAAQTRPARIYRVTSPGGGFRYEFFRPEVDGGWLSRDYYSTTRPNISIADLRQDFAGGVTTGQVRFVTSESTMSKYRAEAFGLNERLGAAKTLAPFWPPSSTTQRGNTKVFQSNGPRNASAATIQAALTNAATSPLLCTGAELLVATGTGGPICEEGSVLCPRETPDQVCQTPGSCPDDVPPNPNGLSLRFSLEDKVFYVGGVGREQSLTLGNPVLMCAKNVPCGKGALDPTIISHTAKITLTPNDAAYRRCASTQQRNCSYFVVAENAPVWRGGFFSPTTEKQAMVAKVTDATAQVQLYKWRYFRDIVGYKNNKAKTPIYGPWKRERVPDRVITVRVGALSGPTMFRVVGSTGR